MTVYSRYYTRKKFTLTLNESVAVSELLHNICTILSHEFVMEHHQASLIELPTYGRIFIHAEASFVLATLFFSAVKKRSKHTNTTEREKRMFSM